jgi:hypothetical protein
MPGVNSASNTLACSSARMGLCPESRHFHNFCFSGRHGGPRSRFNKAAAMQFESRHHLPKRQVVIVENSLDIIRVVMEYLTKKLPNLVVAMPK